MISFVPLILSKDNSNLIERLNKFGMSNLVEQIVKELGATRIPDKILNGAIENPLEIINNDHFIYPCVYLIFFDEHSPLKTLYEEEFLLCQWHISALPVFCYIPSLGSIPFKIKMEEVHGLNSGRPFNIICLSEKWNTMIPALSSYLKELAQKGEMLYGEFFNEAQENVFAHNGNLFRLPYLRIFREDYSISIFYACLEYVLMILHAFVLMDFSIISSSITDKKILQQFEKALYIPKVKLSDGLMYKLLQDSRNILKTFSSTHGIFDTPIPKTIIDGINRLFKIIDSSFKLTNRSWMGFIEACIVLRNVTKGHGVTYYIELDKIQCLLNGVVEFTKVIRTSSLDFHISGRESKSLDKKSFIYYQTIDEVTQNWMDSNRINMKFNESERVYSLYPNILYHRNYDFFYFAGVSLDKTKWYYKNYASGLFIEHSTHKNLSEL